MSRLITTHRVDPADPTRIEARDEPGVSGANHLYMAVGVDFRTNPVCAPGIAGALEYPIVFQNGTFPEVGCNGVTIEALLAISIDRLEGFQRGAYPCPQNAVAIGHLQQALAVLHDRTKQRIERGVEGAHKA